jgi:hypothetical protein
MKSVFKRVLLSSVLAGAGFAALAQGMGGPMGGPPHEGMPAGMHQPDPAKMQAWVAKRLTALKAKLKITADQEGAWATFTAAMKPPVNMGQHPNREEWQNLTTPERIDKMRAARSVRQAEMDKRADAVKAFYGTLTPEQKKIFDAQHMRHGRRGGMHGMGGNKPPQ